jgi:AhpD family alkylhydroperoxidase
VAIDYRALQPELYQAMHGLQEAVDTSGMEPGLLEMVKLRASQINGCSFCVNLHATTAREAGVSDQRLHMVSAWRYARSFTPAEKAALGWCETLTRLGNGEPPGDARKELSAHFSDEQIVALTWAIAAINAWNRVAVGHGQHGGPAPPKAAT